jgi:polysaccharide chain length determinant protein (PEP-CTERM system associated)
LINILRRWPAIVIPFTVIASVTAVVVTLLPNRYRSETLILVVPQRVPEEYVRSTVTTKIEERLRSINQQITSRSRLEPVIKEFNLYPEQARTGLMEDVVDRMRNDIKTEIIRSDAFRISFMSDNPRTAMRVTERLASMYIDESLRDREVLADSTNQFLDSQLIAAKERLVAHEKKLELYKMRFTGQLPTQVPANLQVMQNAQLQIQSLLDSLNRDRDRRLVLEGQLADIASASQAAAAPATVDGAEVKETEQLPPAAAELTKARQALRDMLLRLKDTHPNVVRQQRMVADLELKAEKESEALAAMPAEKRNRIQKDPGEAARTARVAQMQAELTNLGLQIQDKERDEARLRGTISEYQGRVESAPARESELTELMRDYDTLQTSYTSLLKKKEEAQVSANLERHQIGEQFKILDPARLPEKPFSPNRPLFYTAGGGLGLALGLLLAGFLEYRDTTLKTDADVVATLMLPVLAMIPELTTPESDLAAEKKRRRTVLMTASSVAVLSIVVVWAFLRQ